LKYIHLIGTCLNMWDYLNWLYFVMNLWGRIWYVMVVGFERNRCRKFNSRNPKRGSIMQDGRKILVCVCCTRVECVVVRFVCFFFVVDTNPHYCHTITYKMYYLTFFSQLFWWLVEKVSLKALQHTRKMKLTNPTTTFMAKLYNGSVFLSARICIYFSM